MSGHTPGPWSATVSDMIFSGPGKHVADAISGPIPDDPEATANARLIAAAPDLLEACRFVVQRCALYGPADRAREMIRAAINKATGE